MFQKKKKKKLYWFTQSLDSKKRKKKKRYWAKVGLGPSACMFVRHISNKSVIFQPFYLKKKKQYDPSKVQTPNPSNPSQQQILVKVHEKKDGHEQHQNQFTKAKTPVPAFLKLAFPLFPFPILSLSISIQKPNFPISLCGKIQFPFLTKHSRLSQ